MYFVYYTYMNTIIRVLLGLVLALTLLDIVYSGRQRAGRSIAYACVFIGLVLVFHFMSPLFSNRRAE